MAEVQAHVIRTQGGRQTGKLERALIHVDGGRGFEVHGIEHKGAEAILCETTRAVRKHRDGKCNHIARSVGAEDEVGRATGSNAGTSAAGNPQRVTSRDQNAASKRGGPVLKGQRLRSAQHNSPNARDFDTGADRRISLGSYIPIKAVRQRIKCRKTRTACKCCVQCRADHPRRGQGEVSAARPSGPVVNVGIDDAVHIHRTGDGDTGARR